ncbi:c-type cytochrome [Thiomicrorhabdus sp. Milos-T2]|uniref:c-type cytochrome n=1 Tax=Thiomicrorhabdus sp. Milos-T2 TaxID=90814 RepID=UPI00057184DF|nr:c-type cytochrome [Thiomicrorhabdus sp. Milos-T2]
MFTLTKKPQLFLTTALLFSATFAYGSEKTADSSQGPSSNVAWDIEQIRFVRNGDPKKGAELNKTMLCMTCHGEKGFSTGRNWPHLAGQQANYTFKMLKDYKDEKRVETTSSSVMVSLSKKLSDQDMADLSQYYASFPLPSSPKVENFASAEMQKNIKNLLERGDGKRMIAPCLSCHGWKAEGGKTDMPALAGQHPSYFRKTMEDYRSGKRHNDIYGRMRYISEALTNEEINAMAQYFANMNGE